MNVPMTAIFQETAAAAEVRELLAADAIRSVYQPIVDLDSGEVVAYEALARGPVGSSLERPDLLFAAPRRCGLVAELDWACRAAAFSGELPRSTTPSAAFPTRPARVASDSPFAAAFVACGLGDTGEDMARRFDFCLTYDRNLAVDAARGLITRIAPR
jgi:hypothetical protein